MTDDIVKDNVNEIVGYLQDLTIVCLKCANGYDVSDWKPVTIGQANMYGDECEICHDALYR
jgi:hypothetical protein